MNANNARAVILMVDDDPDEYYLAKEALEESGVQAILLLVANKEELFDYLHNRGQFVDIRRYPRPGGILLDVNTPMTSGQEVLASLKSDPEIKDIPVVIYAAPKDPEEAMAWHHLGADSHIAKPASFQTMVENMKAFEKYWVAPSLLPFPESTPAPMENPGMAS